MVAPPALNRRCFFSIIVLRVSESHHVPPVPRLVNHAPEWHSAPWPPWHGVTAHLVGSDTVVYCWLEAESLPLSFGPTTTDAPSGIPAGLLLVTSAAFAAFFKTQGKFPISTCTCASTPPVCVRPTWWQPILAMQSVATATCKLRSGVDGP